MCGRSLFARGILLLALSGSHHVHSFLPPHPSRVARTSSTELGAKTKAKKKKPNKAASGGLKGFGSSSPSANSKSASAGTIDRSPSALKFYDFLQRNGGEANLKRVGLAYFPLQIGPNKEDTIQLRGVMALRDIKKGEAIIEIPYEMALDLGRESSDPTLPATILLQKYCGWKSDSDGPPGDKEKGDYFAMLPPYLSEDCLGSTDFFSDKALDMLQSPMVVEETKMRRDLVQARYERDVETMAQIMSAAEQEQELEALRATSLEDDENLLASGKVAKIDERMALEYRIGVKRALSLAL
ncbi:hypothetical protein ACHAXT_006258 [Thalassiosira profunda]